MGNVLPAEGELKEFKFPANIKQMGNIDKEIKIYVEDYVYTYLYQFAKVGGGEKLAVLIGKYLQIEGTNVVMISGAVEGVATEYNDDDLCFTEASWNYIISQKEKYFKGLTVVGWVHVQPDFGTNLMSRDLTFHRRCFEEPWQVLFVIDPIERSDAFYCYDKGAVSMRQSRGYFIYYEKNEDMQTYIIESNVIKPKEEVKERKFNFGGSGKTAVQRLLEVTGRARAKAFKLANESDRPDAAVRIREILKQKEEIRRKETKNRQAAFMASCGALCIVCFVIFSGLMANRVSIRRLEAELVNVKSTYDDMNRLVTTATAQVFAVQRKEEEKEQGKNNSEETPEDNESALEDDKERIFVKNSPENTGTTVVENGEEYYVYYVEDGDNLWYISREFYGNDEGVDDIMEANGITDSDYIFSGQKLMIPKK